MPKNIVLLSDGTSNVETGPKLTNIGKLYHKLEQYKQDNDTTQVHFYDRGVGTEGLIRRGFGLVAGSGIGKNIRDLYTFLVAHYQPGDNIFVFGFSRGATTARALVGMIRNVGILKKAHKARIKEAYSIYISEQGVDDERATRFRNDFSHPLTEKEKPIKFLGVYDTVVSLGIPGTTDDDSYWFGFHDLKLSRIIKVARHALAIDEKREDFIPTLWEPNPKAKVNSEQRWFAGVHSDIGGSYEHRGLADITYAWMITEAFKQGLLYPKAEKAALLSAYTNRNQSPKFVSNEAASDSDIDEEEAIVMRQKQLTTTPNWNGKQHDSRYANTFFGHTFTFRSHYMRPIGHSYSDESIDPTVMMRREKRQPKYRPTNLNKLNDDFLETLVTRCNDSSSTGPSTLSASGKRDAETTIDNRSRTRLRRG